jgi:hypothetical protein
MRSDDVADFMFTPSIKPSIWLAGPSVPLKIECRNSASSSVMMMMMMAAAAAV